MKRNFEIQKSTCSTSGALKSFLKDTMTDLMTEAVDRRNRPWRQNTRWLERLPGWCNLHGTLFVYIEQTFLIPYFKNQWFYWRWMQGFILHRNIQNCPCCRVMQYLIFEFLHKTSLFSGFIKLLSKWISLYPIITHRSQSDLWKLHYMI